MWKAGVNIKFYSLLLNAVQRQIQVACEDDVYWKPSIGQHCLFVCMQFNTYWFLFLCFSNIRKYFTDRAQLIPIARGYDSPVTGRSAPGARYHDQGSVVPTDHDGICISPSASSLRFGEITVRLLALLIVCLLRPVHPVIILPELQICPGAELLTVAALASLSAESKHCVMCDSRALSCSIVISYCNKGLQHEIIDIVFYFILNNIVWKFVIKEIWWACSCNQGYGHILCVCVVIRTVFYQKSITYIKCASQL